jgi:hypothetical protein
MSTNADATPAAGAGGAETAAPRVEAAEKTRGGNDSVMLWVSGIITVLGVVVSILGYIISHGTSNPLSQNDALTIAIIGVSISVAGGALFIRYSFSSFLKFWLARLTFDLRDDTTHR